ncbi:hypothetical protein BDR05DRAFT_802131 [Suillus weaverae]|nr:hypothetical protein BDR05DRAFT_802131 [Suillus weaverae]
MLQYLQENVHQVIRLPLSPSACDVDEVLSKLKCPAAAAAGKFSDGHQTTSHPCEALSRRSHHDAYFNDINLKGLALLCITIIQVRHSSLIATICWLYIPCTSKCISQPASCQGPVWCSKTDGTSRIPLWFLVDNVPNAFEGQLPRAISDCVCHHLISYNQPCGLSG